MASNSLTLVFVPTQRTRLMAIVDVREPQEFHDDHVKGALNVPLSELKKGAIPALDIHDDVYVYCENSTRAETALNILHQQGFRNLVNVGSLKEAKEL